MLDKEEEETAEHVLSANRKVTWLGNVQTNKTIKTTTRIEEIDLKENEESASNVKKKDIWQEIVQELRKTQMYTQKISLKDLKELSTPIDLEVVSNAIKKDIWLEIVQELMDRWWTREIKIISMRKDRIVLEDVSNVIKKAIWPENVLRTTMITSIMGEKGDRITRGRTTGVEREDRIWTMRIENIISANTILSRVMSFATPAVEKIMLTMVRALLPLRWAEDLTTDLEMMMVKNLSWERIKMIVHSKGNPVLLIPQVLPRKQRRSEAPRDQLPPSVVLSPLLVSQCRILQWSKVFRTLDQKKGVAAEAEATKEPQ
jgi:hypothetical protein